MLRKSLGIILLLMICGCSVGAYRTAPEPRQSVARNNTSAAEIDQIKKREVPLRMHMEPLVLRDTPRVRYFQRLYLSSQRPFIEDSLTRRGYLDMMRTVFEEQQLPPDLVYLAVVESRLLPTARSRSGAVGLWQFMRPTARRFGLRVTLFGDERVHPVKSTRAAAQYLKYLYDRFDDWFLALAAYNGGPARVSRTIKHFGSRDFFELCERGAFRKETADFVHKFIAVTIILRNAEGFGFE